MKTPLFCFWLIAFTSTFGTMNGIHGRLPDESGDRRLAGPDTGSAPATTLVYEVTPTSVKIPVDGQLDVQTMLTNRGDQPITVYWPSGDFRIHRFEIQNQQSGRRIPAQYRYPYGTYEQTVSESGAQKDFQTIPPGGFLSLNISLSPAEHLYFSQVFFREPGPHLVKASLHVVTCREIDPESGVVTDRPEAWTGTLEAAPFTFDVTSVDPPADPGITLTGTVMADDGQAVSDALVQIHESVASVGSIDGRSQRLVDQVLTDSKGQFFIPRLLVDSSYELTTYGRNCLSETQSVTAFNLLKGPPPPYVIRLRQTAVFRSQVVDEHGRPLSDVRISSTTWTDRHGHFSLDVDPQNDVVFFNLWRRGFAPRSVRMSAAEHTPVVLYSTESQKAKGRAVFADGSPVANCQISFRLQDEVSQKTSGHWPNATTDENGFFEIVCPDRERYIGTVVAKEKTEQGDGFQWATPIPPFSRDSFPTEIVFDNRGRILLGLPGATRLPPEYGALNVYCRCIDRNWIVPISLPPGRNGLLIDRLQPGRYRIRAQTDQLGQEWTQTVTVPDQPPYRTTTQLRIPKIEFGSIKAMVLMPDGTRASNIPLQVWSRQTSRSVMTDETGLLSIDRLPPGDYVARPNGSGVAAIASSLGPVDGGQILNAGEIQLRKHAEEFGQLEASLTWDDGRPLANVSYSGTFFPSSTGWFVQPEHDYHSGRFLIELPSGRHQPQFNLRLPGPAGGMHSFFPAHRPSIVTPVDIVAGKSVNRRLVIHRREQPARLFVNIDGDKRLQVTAVVEQPDCSWTQSGRSKLGRAYVFEGLPAGRCSVIARDQHYFDVTEAEFQNGRAEVLLNRHDSGSIRIDVAGRGLAPFTTLGLEISVEVGNLRCPVCTHPTENQRQQALFVSGSPIIILGDSDGNPQAAADRITSHPQDGSLRVVGLGPGKYTVTVIDGDRRSTTNVTVATGQETPVHFARDADGSLQTK